MVTYIFTQRSIELCNVNHGKDKEEAGREEGRTERKKGRARREEGRAGRLKGRAEKQEGTTEKEKGRARREKGGEGYRLAISAFLNEGAEGMGKTLL